MKHVLFFPNVRQRSLKVTVPVRLFLLVFFSLSLYTTAQDAPRVIEATSGKNIFLFFPSPISRAIAGNMDFKFGYNRDAPEKFGVLTALSPKGESTLHVITEDNAVYSFLVRYSGSVSKFEYFFDGSEAVGNIDGAHAGPNPGGTVPTARKITEVDYRQGQAGDTQPGTDGDIAFCRGLLEGEDYYKTLYRAQSDIFLRVTNIAYREDKTYICLAIENRSPVDYDINFIQFNKIAKKTIKKSTYQAIEIKPVETSSYRTFSRVGSMETKRAVFAFDKLSLDRNKLISIEMNELQGERNLSLALGHKYINNPNRE